MSRCDDVALELCPRKWLPVQALVNTKSSIESSVENSNEKNERVALGKLVFNFCRTWPELKAAKLTVGGAEGEDSEIPA